jgi:ribosomal protein L32
MKFKQSRMEKMYEYENLRRVVYESGAVFIPVCPKCGRFVKADNIILINDIGLKKQPNATCSKCGRIEMPFEGYTE